MPGATSIITGRMKSVLAADLSMDIAARVGRRAKGADPAREGRVREAIVSRVATVTGEVRGEIEAKAGAIERAAMARSSGTVSDRGTARTIANGPSASSRLWRQM